MTRVFLKHEVHRLQVSVRLVTNWSAGVQISELEGEVMNSNRTFQREYG